MLTGDLKYFIWPDKNSSLTHCQKDEKCTNTFLSHWCTQCTSFNVAATVRAMLKVIAKVIAGLVNGSSRSTIEAEPTLNFLTARKVACTVQLCNGPCSPNGITRYKTSRKVDLPCELLGSSIKHCGKFRLTK